MTDRKAEIFKALVETPVRILPARDEPLLEGTSFHAEDVRTILGEARLRHRVDLVPAESPDALEETRTKAGKAAAAAVVKKPAVTVAAPEKAPDLRRRLKELKDEIRTLTKKKR